MPTTKATDCGCQSYRGRNILVGNIEIIEGLKLVELLTVTIHLRIRMWTNVPYQDLVKFKFQGFNTYSDLKHVSGF